MGMSLRVVFQLSSNFLRALLFVFFLSCFTLTAASSAIVFPKAWMATTGLASSPAAAAAAALNRIRRCQDTPIGLRSPFCDQIHHNSGNQGTQEDPHLQENSLG